MKCYLTFVCLLTYNTFIGLIVTKQRSFKACVKLISDLAEVVSPLAKVSTFSSAFFNSFTLLLFSTWLLPTKSSQIQNIWWSSSALYVFLPSQADGALHPLVGRPPPRLHLPQPPGDREPAQVCLPRPHGRAWLLGQGFGRKVRERDDETDRYDVVTHTLFQNFQILIFAKSQIIIDRKGKVNFKKT